MGIYKRGDSKYYWLIVDGSGLPPRSTKIPHDDPSPKVRRQLRAQAEIIYKAAMVEQARARADLAPLVSDTITFNKYADWFERHKLPHYRGAERDRYSLKHLRAFFGSDDLTRLTEARASEYATARLATRIGKPPKPGKDDTRRFVAASTVNRELDFLKAMLRAAVPRYLKVSPLLRMKHLRHVKAKKRILLPVEEARLLKVMTPVDQAFFLVALDTLMRLSNMINLRREEFKGGHLELTDSKTGPYTVPLSARAAKALASLSHTGEYFFPHRRTAKTDRDRRATIRRWLQRKCNQADVPYGRAVAGVTFHTSTRATGATRMLQRGHDLRTVQEVGNWRDIRSVAEYLHTDQAHTRAAVESIGARAKRVHPKSSSTTPGRRVEKHQQRRG